MTTTATISTRTLNDGLKLARRMTGTAGAFETNERAYNLRESARSAGIGVIAIVDRVKSENVPHVDPAHDSATRDAIIADHWRGFSAAAVNHAASAHQFMLDAGLSFDAVSDRDTVAYAALQTARKTSLKDVSGYIAEWPEVERADVSAVVAELTDIRASAMVKSTPTDKSKSDTVVNVDKSEEAAGDIDAFTESVDAELTFHQHLAAATALVDSLALDKSEAQELAREIRALAKLVAAIAE